MKRPLLTEPAFDGMDLSEALVQLYGALPEDASLERLKGDASTRSYYRIEVGNGIPRSLIVMRLPPDALRSDEGSSAGRPSELPFVNVQRHLAAHGVPVPKILSDRTSQGFLLLDDLGDETFEVRLHRTPREAWPALYAEAIDLMAAMHRRCSTPDPRRIAYARSFDRALLRWELDHFREWGLEAVGVVLTDPERATLETAFDTLVDRLLALPQGFVHRDYQSRNLMWVPRNGHDELVVIDFQDALLGPAIYDLVALLCDSYVDLDREFQRTMIARLAQARGEPAADLERAFWLMAAQRKLKDAGRFVFIDQVRGNPDFLRHYPQSMAYAARALGEVAELAPIAGLLARKLPGFPGPVPPPEAQTGRHRGATL